jgi:hypothetical protein
MKTINFNQVIDALLDDAANFPVSYLLTLSDITPANLVMLKQSWGQISPVRKSHLMESIELVHEEEITSNFEDIAEIALDDPNSPVRTIALRLFMDFEKPRLIQKFIHLMTTDPDIEVRSQAAIVLGKYVYLLETDAIDERYRNPLEEALIKVIKSDDHEIVRQKALESFGFSSHDSVKENIYYAYHSGDRNWITSALEAIGRSADESYEGLVLPMLAHPDLRIQKAAVFAAGELELATTRKLLMRMALETNGDEDLWVEAVSALSKIGGEGVVEVFELLLERAESDEEEEFLNEAMEELNLTNGLALDFDLLGIRKPDTSELRETDISDDDFDIEDYEPSWVDDLEERLAQKLDSLNGMGDFDENDDLDEDDD